MRLLGAAARLTARPALAEGIFGGRMSTPAGGMSGMLTGGGLCLAAAVSWPRDSTGINLTNASLIINMLVASGACVSVVHWRLLGLLVPSGASDWASIQRGLAASEPLLSHAE